MINSIIIAIALPFVSHAFFSSADLSIPQTMYPSAVPSFLDSDDILIPVSKEHSISRYVPADLVSLLGLGYKGLKVRSVIYDNLAAMMGQASEQGLLLTIVSAYRGYDTQDALFSGYTQTYGEVRANTFSAKPGYSEHQLGTTIDFSNTARKVLTNKFGTDPEGVWLANHAYQYGFTLSYPSDKVSITGYEYEPWHYRYVGVEMATYLFEHNVVLGEFEFEVYK